jgi:shikimate dehydrogenase
VSGPRAFVIGHPIAHSRSPLIHGYWLERYGIAGSYEAIDVPPDGLADFFAALRRGAFAGGNVTIPYKVTVAGFCDDVEPLARKIGAVNTLVVHDARVLGRNSDYLGFLANLDANAPGWDRGGQHAIVLGAGGAARAVLLALAHRGVPDVKILNRTPARAEALAAELGPPFSGHALTKFDAFAPGASLVVNTTSVGMHDTRFADLPLQVLPTSAVVADIVYVPLVTPLLADARARGLRTVDGLGMLLHQAVPGFAAWFGVTPEVDATLRAKVEASL